LSLFYRWAIEEGHAPAEPFTYRTARALFNGAGREVKVNSPGSRTPSAATSTTWSRSPRQPASG
jgi:hypothetical protein